jgi:hypothetical protein
MPADSIRIKPGEAGTLIVQLPYSPDHVAKIKSVAGRRWHAKEQHWTVPQGDGTLGTLLTLFPGKPIDVDPALRAVKPTAMGSRLRLCSFRGLALAMGLSPGTPVDQRQDQGTRTSSHRRITGTESRQGGRGEGRAHKTSHVPYVPPFVCHTSARKRLGHSNRPGVAAASRCQNDDDLHACPPSRACRCPQPVGWDVNPFNERMLCGQKLADSALMRIA